MSIHFYRDECGYVGEPEPPHDRAAEADDAMRDAFTSADALAALLDRHDGDSGDDAALIESWAERIDALAAEVRARLGEPRVMRNGALVPVGAA